MRLDRATRRVVVADDSATYRTILERVLSDAGYSVSCVEDGERLLQLMASLPEPPDLLILELNLPRVRGIDALRKIREQDPEHGIPVLIFTEFISEHLRQVLADLGVKRHLSKYQALRDLLYEVDGMLFTSLQDQRRSIRRLSRLPVNYWLDDKLYVQYCFDLSADGMYVIVADEEPPPVGSRLSLRFWLPSSERLIAASGEVMWCNGADDKLRISHPPGMGVRFIEMTAEDAALVADYVERL